MCLGGCWSITVAVVTRPITQDGPRRWAVGCARQGGIHECRRVTPTPHGRQEMVRTERSDWLISDEMIEGFRDGPVLNRQCKAEVANAVAHILHSVGED